MLRAPACGQLPSESVSRGVCMKQVRFTEDPKECCGKILNEAAVQSLRHCGMKSIHGTDERTEYYICPECYLKSVYPEDLPARRV